MHTTSYQEALRKLPEARAEARRLFAAAPIQPPSHHIVPLAVRPVRPTDQRLPRLRNDHVLALAQRFYAEQRSLIERGVVPLVTAEADDADAVLSDLDDQITANARAECENGEHPATYDEARVLADAQLYSPFLSDESVRLREYLRRANLRLLSLRRARLLNDFTAVAPDPLFDHLENEAQRQATRRVALDTAPALTVGGAAEQYLAEVSARQPKQKTIDRYTSEMRQIVDFFGDETSFATIKREDCTSFRDTLAKLPPNFEKHRRSAQRLTAVDLAARHVDGQPVLAYATLEKYLNQLHRFFEWAVNEDKISKNMAKGLKPNAVKPSGAEAKLPFDTAELRRIIARPIYTGCIDDGRGFAKSGENIIRRSRYWLPLIALFSGLRLEEILQLTPSHVRVSPLGHPFIVLTKDMDLKNSNAEREIPLHPKLLAFGLDAWIDRRRKRPDALLFDDVTADRYGTRSPIFSKRFRADLKHLQLGSRRAKLTFHSFRHTFKSALDNANVPADEKDELCGWTRNSRTARRYGNGITADALKQWIDKVAYDVDFTGLEAHSRMRD
jgi:integrase